MPRAHESYNVALFSLLSSGEQDGDVVTFSYHQVYGAFVRTVHYEKMRSKSQFIMASSVQKEQTHRGCGPCIVLRAESCLLWRNQELFRFHSNPIFMTEEGTSTSSGAEGKSWEQKLLGTLNLEDTVYTTCDLPKMVCKNWTDSPVVLF